MDVAQLKRHAAETAVETYVKPGMILGLGEGTTAIFALRRIGVLLESGALSGVVGVACSLAVEREARALGIPLTTLDEQPVIDLTIDGADEVDPQLNLIKGGGGALLREKMVAQASRREIIVVDERKLVPVLGTHWAVPLEVIEFGWGAHVPFLRDLGAAVVLRRGEDGSPFRTDQGNLILDARFGPIDDLAALALALEARAGIVEHGLFLGLATDVIVAAPEGVRRLDRARDTNH
ncbi:MAG: ribose-5-phosphate isomerase RpiA [Anaerolineae bacterium]|nr:ribose-5-phosphate isomerase RpiA [Anaerolineae bacterium]